MRGGSAPASQWNYHRSAQNGVILAFLAPPGLKGLNPLFTWEVPLNGMMSIVWYLAWLSRGPMSAQGIYSRVVAPQYLYTLKSSSLLGWELEIAFIALSQTVKHTMFGQGFQVMGAIKTERLKLKGLGVGASAMLDMNTTLSLDITSLLRVFIGPCTYHMHILPWLARNNHHKWPGGAQGVSLGCKSQSTMFHVVNLAFPLNFFWYNSWQLHDCICNCTLFHHNTMLRLFLNFFLILRHW